MMTALAIKYEADFSNQENKMGINFKSDTKQYIELDDKLMNSTINGTNDPNMKYSSSLFSMTGTAATVEFTPLSSTTISTTITPSSLSSSKLSQCVGCGLIIYDPFMLNVQPNLKWHIRCLNCSKCLRSLMNDSTCFVRDCKAYCREDYFNNFLYRCAGCYRLIDKMDLVFRIRSRTFHLDCFRCVICEKLLQPGEEIAYRNEQVYCLIHSHLIQKFPKINHHHDSSENDNNNDATTTINNNSNNTIHTDNNNDIETLQLMSSNHFTSNMKNGNHNNNNGNKNHDNNNVQINNTDPHNMNQSIIEQVEINIVPGTSLITNTTCYKNSSNMNMNQSTFTKHCHESFITDDMKSLKSDIKGLLPNLLSHQTDDIQLMTMKSIYCNDINTTNNNVTNMELTPDMENGLTYENLCNSSSTTISMPTIHTTVAFTNVHNNNSNNNSNNNGNNYLNKLMNNRNSVCNSSLINPLNENICPNSPDSSFGAIIQDIDSPMSDSSDDLSREDEDFSLLGMSESNTTGLSENGVALNGSNSLPINNAALNHNLYGNFNPSHLINTGGSGSLTGSTSSSGTSVTSGLGDEVVHSVVISRGTSGLNSGSCGIGGIGSRPSSGKSGGSKRSKDQKTTRVRTVLNEKQLHTLRTCYAANPRPDALMKEQLVEMTSLSPRVIRVWFQNKRCKDKKRQLLLKQMEQHQQNGGRPGSLHGISLIAQSPVRNDVNLMCANSGIDVHHIPGPYWNTQNVQNDLNSRSTNGLYRSHSPSNLLLNQSNSKLIRQSTENTSLSTSSPNSLINYHTNPLNDHPITNYSSGCLLNPTMSNLIPPPPTLPQPLLQTSSLTGIPSLLSTSSTPSCISSSGQNFNCIQSNNFSNSSLNLPMTGTITNDISSANHLRCNSLLIPSNGNNVDTTVINTTTTTNTNSTNPTTTNNSTNMNQSHFLNERSAPSFQQLVRIF
ncbi:unnamed protein product [Schistosoma intercalatum]|nr:unnamed protein product [Schistosoma intercalatum]CAH8468670.1 unnamed protein product [Schistosoma intercalatum]